MSEPTIAHRKVRAFIASRRTPDILFQIVT